MGYVYSELLGSRLRYYAHFVTEKQINTVSRWKKLSSNRLVAKNNAKNLIDNLQWNPYELYQTKLIVWYT
jgi:hypothetical protein